MRKRSRGENRGWPPERERAHRGRFSKQALAFSGQKLRPNTEITMMIWNNNKLATAISALWLLAVIVLPTAAEPFEYDLVEQPPLHNWATTGSASSVLNLVTWRDTMLGCYTDFREYLSPFYHTLVILPKDVAEELKIDRLLEADASETAGVHIFLTTPLKGGSHHSRMLAEQFVTNELNSKGIEIRYLFSILCDIHPLPSNHSNFVSLEQSILRMERDYDVAKEFHKVDSLVLETNYNAAGYPYRCYDKCSNQYPLSKMDIFAMNTAMFEDPAVPTVDEPAPYGNFHGNDHEDWWRSGGFDNKMRNLTLAGLPWITDSNWNFEDHAVMYDLELLRRYKDEYFAVSPQSFPDEKTFIGRFAQIFNMTIVRHNDVALTIEFGHTPVHLNYHPDLRLDWFKNRCMEQIMLHRTPKEWQANWDRAYSQLGIKGSKPWTQFLFRHFHKNQWLPSTIDNTFKVITDEAVKKWVGWVLEYCGYTAMGEVIRDGNTMLRFEMEAVYAASRLVRFESVPGVNKKLLTFKYASGEKFSLFVDEMKTGPPPQNTNAVLEIPADAKINWNGFHFAK